MNRSLWWLAFATILVATSAVAEKFNYNKFTLPTNLVTVGTAAVNGTTLKLTTESPILQAGVVYYPTKVSAHLGFSTNFTWISESCDATYGGGDGFTFFLTKNAPTNAQVVASKGGYLAIGFVPNTFMVGYSAYWSQIYVCNWATPFADQFRYSTQCNVTNIARIPCGTPMNMRIIFDGSKLSVYNSLTLLANYPKEFGVDHYYAGLSGSTGSATFRQFITQWAYWSTTVSFNEYSPTSDQINFYGVASGQGSQIQLTTASTHVPGAAVFSTALNVGFGFRTNFIWAPSNCDSLYDGADGFTFFGTKAAPTSVAVYQSEGSGLGIRKVPNIFMAAYSATYNEFYICSWTDPIPASANSFRDASACIVVANPTPKLNCSNTYFIEVNYAGVNLSLSINGQVKISTRNVVIDENSYFVSLSGATGQGYFRQNISNWNIKTVAMSVGYTSPTYIGVGSVSSLSPVVQLTNGSRQSGAVYGQNTWMYLSYKWQSSFTFVGLCMGAPSRGFTHYFSRFAPTASQVQSAPVEELGIGNVPDVYMIGYDIRSSRLMICDWGAPPTGLPPITCSVAPRPSYTCGTPLNFTVTYDSFTMKLFVNGVLQVSRSVTIYPRYYYGGFSASTSSNPMTQQISNWKFDSDTPQPVDAFSYGFQGQSVILRGSAQVNGDTLTLTNDSPSDANAGLMLHPEPVKMNYGFRAYFNWNASNCDSVNNAGDGFAFVFTKAIPDNSSVSASSGTGLGIQQVPNVAMVGYNTQYNEFYICSWSSPVEDFRNSTACQTISNSAVNALHPQPYACDEEPFLVFGLDYDGYTLRFTQVNNTGEFEIFSGRTLPLDFSSSYYVGLSASVGSGYYKQDSTYIYLVPLV